MPDCLQLSDEVTCPNRLIVPVVKTDNFFFGAL
jgi:hypothetical protein